MIDGSSYLHAGHPVQVGTGMRETRVFILVILAIFVFLGGILAAETIAAAPKHHPLTKQDSYAIYLSPGKHSGVPYGGYHVTLTSFSSKHAPGKSERHEAKAAWKAAHGNTGSLSFSNKQREKDYKACNLGKNYGYGICFNSNDLDRMAVELHKRKFDNSKQLGKVGGDNYRWHVTLYAKTPKEAYDKFEKELKHKPWNLYEVRYSDMHWTPIK